jgi:hypothetical protein
VGDAVAQHVFERAGHLVQHRAIEFGLAVADVQVGALAGILGGLAHHAVQSFGKAFEGHHAHAHQALRQFAGEARLGGDGGVGVVEVAQQVLLHGGDVVHAFGHHPRHFLEAGETVELERIEFLRAFGCQRLLRLHLGFGLDFHFAQLIAQADHVFRQVEQRHLEGQQFAFDAAAGDRDFAGFVDQLVDQVGAYAQMHLRRRDENRGVGRRGQGDPPGGTAAATGGASATGDSTTADSTETSIPARQPCGLFQVRVAPHRDCADARSASRRSYEVSSPSMVVAAPTSCDRLIDAVFHRVQQFAATHGTGHPGAALERMQGALQRAGCLGIVRSQPPVAQQARRYRASDRRFPRGTAAIPGCRSRLRSGRHGAPLRSR